MASWDNVGLPTSPQARDFASPLLDFAPIGNLANDYFTGTQQRRTRDLQQPITASGSKEVAAELMRRGGSEYAAQLMPFLQQQEAGQPSPIFGGPQGAPGLPVSAQPMAAGPSPAGAPVSSPLDPTIASGPRPAVAMHAPTAGPGGAPAGGAAPRYAGGDNGSNTLMSIAGDFYGDEKGAQVALRAAQAFKLDPNQPLTPEQIAKVQGAFSSASGRPLEQGAVPAAPPAAASPAGAATPGAAPGSPVILPPGYDDPRKAVVALRREAARVGANPYGKDQAKELSDWANRIDAAVAGPRQFGVIGHDENGLPLHGFIDPYNQSVKTPAGMPAAPAGPTADLTGEQYLSTLDPGRANQIKAIVEGRMGPPSGMALKSPQIQALMRQAAQYEPGFDLTKWGARAATAKDFASGKASQNITAFNTAISHLDTLDKAIDKLGNRSMPFYNKMSGMAQEQIDPQYAASLKQFRTAKTAVADELTRAFRGAGGNVHDIVQWEKAINEADSPEALHAAVKQATELLRGRIEALGDQYNRGMSTSRAAPELLSKKAQIALARLSGEPEPKGAEGAPTPAAPAAAKTDADGAPKITVTTKQQYDALEPGATFIGSDGKPWQKPKAK